MSVQETFAELDAFALCQGLPQWINQHHPSEGEARFRAGELEGRLDASPTLVVEMSDAAGLVATYKCSVMLNDCGRRTWLVFSPLVVIWEKSRQERGAGFGRLIIEHCVSSVESFCGLNVPHVTDILVASGNLTTAKGGKPFFEGLGWEIVGPAALTACGNDGLAGTLAFIAAQIEAAISPFRRNAAVELEPLSFAILRVRSAETASSRYPRRIP